MAKPRTSGHVSHKSKDEQRAADARRRAMLSQRGVSALPIQLPPAELEEQLKAHLARRPSNLDIPAITRWVWEKDRLISSLTLSMHQYRGIE